MIVQISSGQGPVECEFAVKLLFESLKKEFDSECFVVKSANASKFCDGFSSIVFETSADLSFLEGSVEWKCESFLRPGHKRKNWFVDVSLIPDCVETKAEGEIEWQFFRCGGNGGQNVNKVSTGVRLMHKTTGITVLCTEERSQSLNRKRALEKLQLELENINRQSKEMQNYSAWKAGKSLVRGNPVRVYEGREFRLKKNL